MPVGNGSADRAGKQMVRAGSALQVLIGGVRADIDPPSAARKHAERR